MSKSTLNWEAKNMATTNVVVNDSKYLDFPPVLQSEFRIRGLAKCTGRTTSLNRVTLHIYENEVRRTPWGEYSVDNLWANDRSRFSNNSGKVSFKYVIL